MDVQRVGFIGLGAMGEPMCRMLLRRGFALTITVHRNAAPAERLVAEGATVVATAAEVAARSEVVVVCVPDAPQVEAVILGPQGVLAGAAPGLIVVDMSTIAPAATRHIAATLAAHGISFLDAPVSGGPARAATGALTIMVGGAVEALERCRPVLAALGSKIVHVGDVGQGEVVKLVNNTISAVIMTVLGEALTLGVKGGVPVETLREVVLASAGANYLLETWIVPTVLADQYSGGFALELMHKDLHAALQTARELGVPMPVTALAQQLYALQRADHARDDYSAVTLLSQEAADVVIATGKRRSET